jgi:hypothetical protein
LSRNATINPAFVGFPRLRDGIIRVIDDLSAADMDHHKRLSADERQALPADAFEPAVYDPD